MDDKTQLRLYEGKRDTYFSRVQRIYDSIKTLSTEKARKSFIAQGKQIDTLRSEFSSILDHVNALNLQLDPKYEISYTALNAFDNLACEVKEAVCSLTKSSSSVTKTHSSSSAYHIKIPKIELPTFDGDIQSFPYFYETFKRVIHTNSELSDSDRIHYLLSCLKGKAKNVAISITPCAENYRVVLDSLTAKYLDNRALAVNYLNQLFSLKSTGSSPANIEGVFDKFTATVAGLKQLKIDKLDDFIFTHLGLKLIDSDTAKQYEMSLRTQASPQTVDYDYFVNFVREQVKIMYRTAPQRSEPRSTANKKIASGSSKVSQVYVTTTSKCSLCNSSHLHLFKCSAFLKLSVNDRFKFIKDNRICGNCLSSQHTVSKCQSQATCKKCSGKHHSLLHFDQSSALKSRTYSASSSFAAPVASPAAVFVDTATNPERVALCTHSALAQQTARTTEMLATAKVLVVGRKGRDTVVRCLLDPGSQKNYITTRCRRMLGLPIREHTISTVKGIGGTSQPVRGSVDLTFSSRLRSQPKYDIDALVLDQITGQLPLCTINIAELNHNIDPRLLADDPWGVPGNIDMLLGVRLFAKLLRPGGATSMLGCPDVMETVLGYVLMGEVPIANTETASLSFCAFSSLPCCDLGKFWENEEVATSPLVSLDDTHCEQFYCATITRPKSGGFIAALPLKTNATALGNSFEIARRRYPSLERKLKAKPNLKLIYDDVIKEYLKQSYIGLMQGVLPENILRNREVAYYRTCTKRNTLSSSARLFNVLGLVARMILYAKLLIKKLWLGMIGWDDVPPTRIVRLWDQFQAELLLILQMRFARHKGVEEICKVSLVDYADASEKAYGGVVYAHVVKPNSDIVVTPVHAKSKVAPLKVVSLARLELCTALLLSILIKRVLHLFAARHAIEAVVAFSDSTLTVSWIHSAPHRWYTYATNRIAKIHENLSVSKDLRIQINVSYAA